MIRMSLHMHTFRAEETDQYLRLQNLADPQSGEDLIGLVAEARAGNGQVPFREHDLQTLLERRRNGNGGNGVTLSEMVDVLDELEAMG